MSDVLERSGLAIKVIESFEGASLKDDPWSYTQIQRAVALGLGVKSEAEYSVATI